MHFSSTDQESYITDHTLVYEDNNPMFLRMANRRVLWITHLGVIHEMPAALESSWGQLFSQLSGNAA
jgi:hypothetical protein